MNEHEKQCTKCKRNYPLSCFSKDIQKRDGLCSACKACMAQNGRQWYRFNKDKRLLGCSKWNKDNSEKVYTYQRKYKKTHREKLHAWSKVWKKNNPEKHVAHVYIGKALKKGTIKKTPCNVCASEKNLHAHHEDYSKRLTVIWLCASCHGLLHKTKTRKNNARNFNTT